MDSVAPSSEEAEKENPVLEKTRKSPEPVEDNQGKSSESYLSKTTALSFIVDIYLGMPAKSEVRKLH